MRKTKILLLAGVVLPAFAIAAPSIAAPLASDQPMVVAQSDDGGKEQRRQEKQERREERQQSREDRQQERQQSREDRQQERAQTREERPSREERQQDRAQTREERPSRDERQQSREDRQQDRAQTREERPSHEERTQQREERQQDRAQTREERPSREERQQNREDRAGGGAGRPNATGADSGANDNSGRGGDRLKQMREDRERDRAGGAGGGSGTAGADSNANDRSGRGGDDRLKQMREDRERERAGGGDKDKAGRGDDRLKQMREDRERERAGGGDKAKDADKDRAGRGDNQDRDRAGGDDRRDRLQDLRDDRRDRRDDARQDDREDRLRDRLRDERRENDRLGDRIDKLKDQRKETRDGTRVIITEPGGRRIIRDGDKVIIRRDETARFRFGVDARNIREERRGGEIRTVVTRPDGSRVITITDEDGRLLRRIRESGGREYVLIDNRPRGGRDGVFLNLDIAPPRVSIPRERYIVDADVASRDDIEEAFDAPPVERLERSYSLDEIRQSKPLREYVRSVDLDSITFDTGSWDVRDDQISKLEKVGKAMEDAVKKNPRTVFMVEGHTDAVGGDDDNLSLSDRRAESVAEVLTKYFDIPAENLTTQGYGEQYLKVQTDGPEERNRRVTVRNITPLLTSEK